MSPSGLVPAAALVVLFVAGAGLLVLRMHDNKRVKASVTITVGHQPELAVTAVLQALVAIRGSHLESLTPYRSVLVVHRTPSWAILPAVWLFPVGVFFLLLSRQVQLQVSLYASQSGTVVRLTGPTEQALLRHATRAVLSLPGAREGLDRTPTLSLY